MKAMIRLSGSMYLDSDCEFTGCDFELAIPPPTEEDIARQREQTAVLNDLNDINESDDSMPKRKVKEIQ